MKYLRWAAAAMVVAIAGSPAWAQKAPVSRLQTIQETGVLRVGTTGDYNPMSFRDTSKNEFRGHQIDAATQLAKDLGVKLQFVPSTWATLINGLDANQYDIVMSGTAVSVKRALSVAHTLPWGSNAYVPLVRAADAGRFKQWSDLDRPEVSIGTNLGTTMEQVVQESLPKATLRRVESPARDWQELLGKRVDVTLSSVIESAALVREHPELVAILKDQPLRPSPMAFLVPQQDQLWLNFVNTWIGLRQTSGFFAELEQRWGIASR